MEDLCAFCASESLPAVDQAAIAQAQFETIHPFADGNGRTGRALIQLVLRRLGPGHPGAAARLPGPGHLGQTISTGSPSPATAPATGQAAQADLNMWVGRFADACQRAVRDAALLRKTHPADPERMAHQARTRPRELRR